MALLLETTLGDIVIDLDIEGSPKLCKNVLKLAKARFYTSTLIYNVHPQRFCQLGDPRGDGTGGACIYGFIDTDGSHSKVINSSNRFLKSSSGRPLSASECQERGRVVATEMNGIADTIGSQFLITLSQGPGMALDEYSYPSPSSNSQLSKAQGGEMSSDTTSKFRSIGIVTEDENNILDKIAATYCDANGRPYADIRVLRALVIDDPFEDPPGMDSLLQQRGIKFDTGDRITDSPDWERPPEEVVELRIPADQVDPADDQEDAQKIREQEEKILDREDKSRAVVLEMLGDLPSADVKTPENVLFVCKLNPVTEDEDLELIFSRFDEKVKAEIIRDTETGNSLQYAFVEFSTKEQAVAAYFKMNNTLVDDRRIKVDFSQSVAKEWNKYTQQPRRPKNQGGRLVGSPGNYGNNSNFVPTTQRSGFGQRSGRSPHTGRGNGRGNNNGRGHGNVRAQSPDRGRRGWGPHGRGGPGGQRDRPGNHAANGFLRVDHSRPNGARDAHRASTARAGDGEYDQSKFNEVDRSQGRDKYKDVRERSKRENERHNDDRSYSSNVYRHDRKDRSMSRSESSERRNRKHKKHRKKRKRERHYDSEDSRRSDVHRDKSSHRSRRTREDDDESRHSRHQRDGGRHHSSTEANNDYKSSHRTDRDDDSHDREHSRHRDDSHRRSKKEKHRRYRDESSEDGHGHRHGKKDHRREHRHRRNDRRSREDDDDESRKHRKRKHREDS